MPCSLRCRISWWETQVAYARYWSTSWATPSSSPQQGEVVVTVEAALPVTDAVTLHVAVRDTGIGIPADKQHLILEPFTQADGSTTRQYGGTGLGLAISKQLAELMGGRLWLESEVGRGSIFHFTVRFSIQPASAPPQMPATTVDVHRLPVLVVDDNATTRRMLHEMLTHWQMQPTAVEAGQTALAILTQARDAGTPYPLVLLDACMPEMDGFTVAARLGQDPTLVGATILMLSSADPSGDAARCRELGIFRYLTKPIVPSDLWEAIMTTPRTPAHDDRPALSVPHPSRPRAHTAGTSYWPRITWSISCSPSVCSRNVGIRSRSSGLAKPP